MKPELPPGRALSADKRSIRCLCHPVGSNTVEEGKGEPAKQGQDVGPVGSSLLLRTLFVSLGGWAFLLLCQKGGVAAGPLPTPVRCAELSATSCKHFQVNLVGQVFLLASERLACWDWVSWK